MGVRRMVRGAAGVLAVGVFVVPGQAWAETGSSEAWTASTPAPAPVPVGGSGSWSVTEVSGSDPASGPGAGLDVEGQMQRAWLAPVVVPPAWGGSSRRRPVSRLGVRHRVRSDCAGIVSAGGVRMWRVRPGDTLSLISRCVGVPVPVLAGHNEVTDPDLILVGQRLVIPARAS